MNYGSIADLLAWIDSNIGSQIDGLSRVGVFWLGMMCGLSCGIMWGLVIGEESTLRKVRRAISSRQRPPHASQRHP
jgi:hypothetical protein